VLRILPLGLAGPADSSSSCLMRRMLGERMDPAPPMCCEDIDLTGSAEIGRVRPMFRSRVPVPRMWVLLE